MSDSCVSEASDWMSDRMRFSSPAAAGAAHSGLATENETSPDPDRDLSAAEGEIERTNEKPRLENARAEMQMEMEVEGETEMEMEGETETEGITKPKAKAAPRPPPAARTYARRRHSASPAFSHGHGSSDKNRAGDDHVEDDVLSGPDRGVEERPGHLERGPGRFERRPERPEPSSTDEIEGTSPSASPPHAPDAGSGTGRFDSHGQRSGEDDAWPAPDEEEDDVMDDADALLLPRGAMGAMAGKMKGRSRTSAAGSHTASRANGRPGRRFHIGRPAAGASDSATHGTGRERETSQPPGAAAERRLELTSHSGEDADTSGKAPNAKLHRLRALAQKRTQELELEQERDPQETIAMSRQNTSTHSHKDATLSKRHDYGSNSRAKAKGRASKPSSHTGRLLPPTITSSSMGEELLAQLNDDGEDWPDPRNLIRPAEEDVPYYQAGPQQRLNGAEGTYENSLSTRTKSQYRRRTASPAIVGSGSGGESASGSDADIGLSVLKRASRASAGTKRSEAPKIKVRCQLRVIPPCPACLLSWIPLLPLRGDSTYRYLGLITLLLCRT